MKCCKIKLNSLPKILFACSADIKNYHNEFRNREQYIELCCIQEGNILIKNFDGQTEVRSPGMLCAILSDCNYETTSRNGEHQKHITVGVCVDYSMESLDTEQNINLKELKEELREKQLILIPYCAVLGSHEKEVISRIKKIISFYHSGRPGDEMKATAEWLSFVGFLTELSVSNLDHSKSAISPSEKQYAQKAILFIQEHYAEKLSVNRIAEELSLSEGYLHRIFKKTYQTGILEYINRYRVAMVIELIQNRNISLGEASQSVGIDDTAYMSRLFKKVTGLCYRDYFNKIGNTTKMF